MNTDQLKQLVKDKRQWSNALSPDDEKRGFKGGYLTDVPGACLISHHKDWSLALRIMIALIPLAAALLYVRGVVRWVRGMDELHRQITVAAFGFAAVTYLFLAAAWSQLVDRADTIQACRWRSRWRACSKPPSRRFLTWTAIA